MNDRRETQQAGHAPASHPISRTARMPRFLSDFKTIFHHLSGWAAEPFEAVTLIGRRVSFTPASVWQWTANARFTLFAGAGGFIYFLFDVHGLSAEIGTLGTFFYWQFAAATTILFYLAGLFTLTALLRRISWSRIYLPVVPVLTILPTIQFNRLILWLVTGFPVPAFPEMLFYVAHSLSGVLVFEVLLFEFVLPVVRARTGPATAAPQAAPTAEFEISARSFAVSDICHIRSTGHYLEFHLCAGRNATVYGTLAEIRRQSQPDWGFSPHRSYWVAAASIEKLCRVDGKPVLTLRDGTRIPVSRSRLRETRHWLDDRAGETHRPPA